MIDVISNTQHTHTHTHTYTHTHTHTHIHTHTQNTLYPTYTFTELHSKPCEVGRHRSCNKGCHGAQVQLTEQLHHLCAATDQLSTTAGAKLSPNFLQH